MDHDWRLLRKKHRQHEGSRLYECAFCHRQVWCVPGILSTPAPPRASDGHPCIREMPSWGSLPTVL